MARVRTNKNICLYCFGDLDSNRVCMNCHRKADDTPAPAHHLPQRTVIGTQNRYLIAPQYRWANDFHEGRAEVQTADGRWAAFDYEGRQLTEFGAVEP